MHSYDTVSEATNDLHKRGFTLDFNLDENCILCNKDRFHPEDFEIVEFYRFEGQTDPADEAVVYAIEAKNGVKGILVNGYGISAQTMSSELIKKLNFHH
ncbi:MAG: phosphoribosylpyrophosphate synthetase [Cytophagaceae bacterium]|nr:phosphoribosylpyrophosphate synthetase [Cytophagaceae bacterium]